MLVATIAEQPFTIAKIPVSSWTFGIRVWLAMILALFVSFWLQLEAPATAAVTVGILAEPTRGQALDKAGFRLLGTVVGVTASIAITGLFSQERDLILAAFAAWIGILRLCGEPLGRLSGLCRSTLWLHGRTYCDTADRHPATRV
jgi:uncharacterized membrane protein YccC